MLFRSRAAFGVGRQGVQWWALYRWQQCLAFLPDPHGHGEFLGILVDVAGSVVATAAAQTPATNMAKDAREEPTPGSRRKSARGRASPAPGRSVVDDVAVTQVLVIGHCWRFFSIGRSVAGRTGVGAVSPLAARGSQTLPLHGWDLEIGRAHV